MWSWRAGAGCLGASNLELWPAPAHLCLLCFVPWANGAASLASMPPQFNDCGSRFPPFRLDVWSVSPKGWRGCGLILGPHVGLPSSVCQLCGR